MVIGPSLPLLAQPLPRPIPSTPASTADVVDVRPQTGTTLWWEARQAGLIGATAATPGPIGHLLSAEARRELGEVITWAAADEANQRAQGTVQRAADAFHIAGLRVPVRLTPGI